MLHFSTNRLKLIVFSLLFATAANAAIFVKKTSAGVYEVTVDAPGQLAAALKSDSLSTATTLNITTASGVKLSELDVRTLLYGGTYNDQTIIPWAARGESTPLSLSLCNADAIGMADGEGWSSYLSTSYIDCLTSFTYPKSAINIPIISNGTVHNLKRLFLPERDDNNVFILAEGAFESLANLEVLGILNCVDDIPARLCKGLNKLNEVNLRCAVKTIGANAFNECHNLEYISLPEGLTSIGDNAFLESKITGIRLPSTLKTIGNSVFQGCKYLEEIVIPASVETIGNEAFRSCNSLKDVYIQNANTKITVSTFDPQLTGQNIISDGFPNNLVDGTSYYNVNRDSYWRTETFNINSINGLSLLHIYIDDDAPQANKDLYNGVYKNARHMGTGKINGQAAYSLPDESGKRWPNNKEVKSLDDYVKYFGTKEIDKEVNDENGKRPASDGYEPTYVPVPNTIEYTPVEAGYEPSYKLFSEATDKYVIVTDAYGSNPVIKLLSNVTDDEKPYAKVLVADTNNNTPGTEGYITTYENVFKLVADSEDREPGTDDYATTYGENTPITGYVYATTTLTKTPGTTGYKPKYELLEKQNISDGIYLYSNSNINSINKIDNTTTSEMSDYYQVLAENNGKKPGDPDYVPKYINYKDIKDEHPADEGYIRTTEKAVVDIVESETTYGTMYYDPRNWQRFALVDSYTKEEEWTVPRIIDDTWYTICLPFSMTKAQIQSTFGGATEVCEFDGVREVTNGGNSVLNIAFTTDKMTAAPTGSTDVIEAYHPYMIHPSTHTGDNTLEVFRVTGITVPEPANYGTPVAKEGASTGDYVAGYKFVGTFTDTDLNTKAGCYFLAVNPNAKNDVDKKYPRFYRATASSKGKWKQYTAIVIPPSNSSQVDAKNMAIYLGDNIISYDPMIIEGNDEVTSIDQDSKGLIVDTCTDNRVYNMQGVCLGTDVELSKLKKGLYIINGKKYIVR